MFGIDTGFIVHNERTYPTLLRLFDELGVETQDSEMSMSIRCDGCGLEFAGAREGGKGIIARPSSLLRGRYQLMLAEMMRFYRRARTLIDAGASVRRRPWRPQCGTHLDEAGWVPKRKHPSLNC